MTELVISELLWLNYNSPEKPVYLYINSIGSQTPMNEVRPRFTSQEHFYSIGNRARSVLWPIFCRLLSVHVCL